MNNILIADDHSIVRFGLQLMVQDIMGNNFEIDFAKDGLEVLKLTQEKQYLALILDINMPNSDSLNLVRQIISNQLDIKILILSVNSEKVYAKRYLEAGAYGYVQKNQSDEELRNAIAKILSGQRYFSSSQMLHFTETFLKKQTLNPFDNLSEREFTAAMLLLEGRSISEIAKIMHISSSTASTHKSKIYDKLSIKSIMDMAKLARLHDVLDERIQ